jgi:hypothetical protein
MFVSDRDALFLGRLMTDRRSGLSLTHVAKKHGISRASVCRMGEKIGVAGCCDFE